MANPREAVVCGQKVMVYPISYLARKLGRANVTLRLWERDGTIPKASIRLPNGWRYYLHAEVAAMVDIAQEEGIRQGKGLNTTNFSQRVWKAIDEIWKNMETQNGKKNSSEKVSIQEAFSS